MLEESLLCSVGGWIQEDWQEKGCAEEVTGLSWLQERREVTGHDCWREMDGVSPALSLLSSTGVSDGLEGSLCFSRCSNSCALNMTCSTNSLTNCRLSSDSLPKPEEKNTQLKALIDGESQSPGCGNWEIFPSNRLFSS